MRSMTVFVLALVACSASEAANRSIRCDADSPCPGELVCYREFCIPADAPREDLDASSITGDMPGASGDASSSSDPGADATSVVPVDLLDADTVDGLAPVAEDAQTPSVDPVDPVNPVEPDASTDGSGNEPPVTPVVDSGAPVAAGANSAALLVCLPSCSQRNVACLRCLRNVLEQNPQVCSAAAEVNEPLVVGLCEWLCTDAACQAPP